MGITTLEYAHAPSASEASGEAVNSPAQERSPVVGDQQIELLAWAGAFLEKCRSHGIDTGSSAICRLDSSHQGPGRDRLQLARQEGFALRAWLRFGKSVLGFPFLAPNYGDPTQGRIDAGAFDSVVVTWSKKGDFDDLGGFRDRYLGACSSDHQETLWVCLAVDGYLPPVVEPNVHVLIARSHTAVTALKQGLKSVGAAIRSWRTPRAVFHAYTSACTPANAVGEILERRLLDSARPTVVMPYEGQPFQHQVVESMRQRYEGVHAVGYMHSMLPALPTDYIFRTGSPDRLVVHGSAQAELLTRHLGWSDELVETLPSLRFGDALEGLKYAGQVVLPYDVTDVSGLLSSFAAFLVATPSESLPVLRCREHPLVAGSRNSTALAEAVDSLLASHGVSKGGESDSDVSVVLGVSAVLFEALEAGLKVASVVSDPVLEGRGPGLWPALIREEVSFGASWLRLSSRGSYIAFREQGIDDTVGLGALLARP